MKQVHNKPHSPMVVLVIVNILLIALIVFSVLSVFTDAQQASYAQNLENIRTLTDASANKVELVVRNYTQQVRNAAEYINAADMTLQQVRNYFLSQYAPDRYNWQLIDNLPDVSSSSFSMRGFYGTRFQSEPEERNVYNTISYQDLAKIFCMASEDTIGTFCYTREFRDTFSLKQCFAVTTTVRVREQTGKCYKTLMLLLESQTINAIIANNNTTDNLKFYNYSNIIVDSDGNYVISNQYFQGTNFLDYIDTFDADFTDTQRTFVLNRLMDKDTEQVLRYKNNREADCIYTLSSVAGTDWFVLSLVPVDSFHNQNKLSSGYYMLIAAFLLLFAVDMFYIKSANTKLRATTKQAEEASQAKSKFLSSMSHDIRTPMNAIVGMTVIANKHLEDPEPDREAMKDCMKTIALSSDHLLTLINDILDISKIESGKLVMRQDDISIAEALNNAVEILQPNLISKNIVFHTCVKNMRQEYVYADELRIKQIFINILSNAVKYTDDGGCVSAELEQQPITGTDARARFVYTVTDTGIGMDETFAKTVFDPFSRAVDTRINHVQGTGLGLAIVKQLVDMLGGTIEVQSALNDGSTFTVTLELPLAPQPPEEQSLAQLRALLVSDDAALDEELKPILTDILAQCDIAQTEQAAASLISQAQENSCAYDLFFVSWQADGDMGLHTVRTLRQRLGEQPVIVLLSDFRQQDMEHQVRDAGADAVAVKPLYRSKLAAIVREQLTRADRQAQTEQAKFPDVTVLVAEDNFINWMVLSQILSFHEIRADHAENGAQAVQMLQEGKGKYDLIFMDVQMPVMNGYEATRTIRALDEPAFASIPIYAMTADAFAEDVNKSSSVGMNGHIPKPIDVDTILRIIRDVRSRKNSAVSMR